MHKLKNIYNRLSIFDKSFLDMYYQLKLDAKSKRWKFYQRLKRVATGANDNANDERNNVSKGSVSQIKRRLRNDIESVILFRLLSCSESEDKNCKHMLYRNLLLAEYYLENEMFDDCRKKLNQVSRFLSGDSFISERLLYNELLKRLEHALGSANDNILYDDTISILKTIELRVTGEMEMAGFNKSGINSENMNSAKPDTDSGVMHDYYRDIVIPKRRVIKKEWRDRNYTKALEIVEWLFVDVYKKCPDYKDVELECLIYKANLNLYLRKYNENVDVFNAINSDYKMRVEQRKEMNIIRFMASFLDGCLEDCNTVYSNMLSDRSAFLNPNDIGLLRYFKCLILFWNGKYHEMRSLISGETKLFSLPDNIGLNIRLIEIYSLVIDGEYDLCRYRLESFRQAVNRRITKISVRYYLIERLLYNIITTGNTYKAWDKYNKLKETYGVNNVRFIQDIQGFELVSVEEFISLYDVKVMCKEREKEVFI